MAHVVLINNIMARYENKKMKRIKDDVTGQDHFQTERLTAEYDLSKMRFLSRGIDTIRQLYNCSLRPEIFSQITNHWDSSTSDVIEIGSIKWKLTSSGKKTGYKYILKNLDIGIVVLLKSFYCEVSEHGGHLKLEATPQLIDHLGLEKLTNRLREIASLFATTLEPSGLAAHLYLDIKNLDLPDDLEQKLVTRSKRNLRVNTISSGHFDANTASFVYGKGQTYMFGDSGSLQLCIYDKVAESLKSDKLSFHESIWRRTPKLEDFSEPEYDDGSLTGEPDSVHRIEFRIHHSVLKQFENGHFNETQLTDSKGNLVQAGELSQIREPKHLKKHIDGLWSYCLNNFRLHHSSSYVHPIWQKIEEDIKWFGFADGWEYTRSAKKSPGTVSRRNVAMWLGNHLRLASRSNKSVHDTTTYLMQSGLHTDLIDYFRIPYGEHDTLYHHLLGFVTDRLTDHKLNGVCGYAA